MARDDLPVFTLAVYEEGNKKPRTIGLFKREKNGKVFYSGTSGEQISIQAGGWVNLFAYEPKKGKQEAQTELGGA